MLPYLIIDVIRSLYYHQSETKMADSSEDELSNFFGNLSVVSVNDFEVSSSSEESVREEKLENELAAMFFSPVRCIILPRTGTSHEISRE